MKVGDGKPTLDLHTRGFCTACQHRFDLLHFGDQTGVGRAFRALSERLATGPGAIYWHIANKSDLLTAACDAVVARTMNETVVVTTPEATIRAVALGLFDVIDKHPW